MSIPAPAAIISILLSLFKVVVLFVIVVSPLIVAFDFSNTPPTIVKSFKYLDAPVTTSPPLIDTSLTYVVFPVT